MRMKSTAMMVGIGAIMLFAPAMAMAQEQYGGTYFANRIRAPKEALELGVSAGYSQGIGFLRDGEANKVSNVSGPGFGVGGLIGYRFTPQFSLAVTTEYGELRGTRDNSARTLSPGVEAAFHMSPYRRIDPWVSLGVGYRFFWDVDTTPGATALTHGLRLGRAAIGLDMRAGEHVAIGPMVGADVNMMLWDRGPDGVQRAIPRDNLAVSTFFFAGIQGRFDVTDRYARDPAMLESAAR